MSAHKKLMDAVAGARPRGLEPTHRPDPAPIMAHPRPAAGHRTTRRLVLAGVVPTVALVATAGVVLGTQGAAPERGGPVTAEVSEPAPASARELLLVAADRSASATATSGSYLVISEERGEIRPEGVRRMAFERWYPTAPGGTVTEFYQPVEPPGERGYVRLPERETGWYNASALPAEPAALRQSLLGQWTAYSGEQLSDFELFRAGVGLALDLRLRPEVRAAAFRMLAGIDGVTALGQVKDQKGRAGVAVGYARTGDGGTPSQIRLIIDPGTGRPLADESWSAGALMSYRLVIGSRYTDDAPPVESAKPRGGR